MKRVLRVHARPEGRAYVHARAACPPKLAREHHERRRKARAYALCLICALCLIGAATIGAQQIPTAPRPGGIAAPAPPATDVATKKPGVIRGRVLLANGRPARRALVSLAVVNGFPRMVKTDLDGRYEFTQVLPGDYRVSAGKPGYLVIEFGQRRAFECGTVLTVGSGETLEKIDITLPINGAISGRIVDRNGDAIEGLLVRLLELRVVGNRRQLLPVAGVPTRPTNDQGQYRLFGVSPGQYAVLALRGQSAVNVLPAGYTATYFPGTSQPSNARFVSVDLSQEVSDVNFAMDREATARISGTVFNASGQPARASVILSRSQRSGSLIAEPATTGSNADGSFRFEGVTPGEWVLQARLASDVNQGGEGEFVSRFVSVAGDDLSDVRLQLSAGSRVEGKIVFEGADPPNPTNVTITTLPSNFDLAPVAGPAGRARVQADGTFVLEGLNGPRRFQLLGTPTTWHLKTVSINGRDIADEPMSFGTKDESLTNVELVLTRSGGSIGGAVVDARGSQVSDYTVIAFATDSSHWYLGSPFQAVTRPKSDGTFAIGYLPPGQYRIAAVDRMRGNENSGEWQDPALLNAIAPYALEVNLTDGQAATLTPRLIVR